MDSAEGGGLSGGGEDTLSHGTALPQAAYAGLCLSLQAEW